MSARNLQRPAVVLAISVLVGAGLVELGSSFAASVPPAPPIVVVLRPAPLPEPLPAPMPAVAVVAVPAAVKAPPKASRSVRVRRSASSPLPEGVVAGLERNIAKATGAVARELVAGARALERGTAYTAWSHFTRALAFDRDNRDALLGVALCHYELNQKGAADRALARLLSLDPTHPEASILRGFIAQLAGDVSAAIEWYERALPRLGDDAVAEELRAVIGALRPQLSLAPSATARATNRSQPSNLSSPQWRSP